MGFNDRVDRSNADTRLARELPEKVAAGVISEAVQDSVAIRMGNVHQMSTFQERLRVTAGFTQTYWLDGETQVAKDSAHKQTTTMQWSNVTITPDELAVLVVMPDAWVADSDIGKDELKKELKRAFAKAIDLAILFGVGAPDGFGDGVVPGAIAAGNYVDYSALPADESDYYGGITAMGELLAEQGFNLNGLVAEPAFKWKAARQRDGEGRPLLQPDMRASGGNVIAGLPFEEVVNGTWDSDAGLLLGGQWDDLHIGIRQGITIEEFNQGTITDPATGLTTYNAMQQDGKVLRAVMRLGYCIPVPAKVLGGEFPFAVLTADAPSS